MPGLHQESIDPLDSLESQIEELEKKILGSYEISNKESHIIDTLVHSNTIINESVANHGAIKILFDRLDQLGKFLDPSFEDSLIDVACKKKVVLESENELRNYLQQSKKICELNNTLSGEPFKNVPSLVESLRKVSEDANKIQTNFDKLKDEIVGMSDNYKDAITILTKSLLIFDTQLAKIEEQMIARKPLDEPIVE